MTEEHKEAGWNSRQAAEGQLVLVRQELQRPIEEIAPYRQLVRVLTKIMPELRSDLGNRKDPIFFTDLGCGVGHYKNVLDKAFPDIFRYRGYDTSQHMVDVAQKLNPPDPFPFVRRFHEAPGSCELGVYPSGISGAGILLLSGLLEFLPQPENLLRSLLKDCCYLRHLIVHRIRTDLPPCQVEQEDVYGQKVTRYGISPDTVHLMLADAAEKEGRTPFRIRTFQYETPGDADKFTVVLSLL